MDKLTEEQYTKMMETLHSHWSLIKSPAKLVFDLKFSDFKTPLSLVSQIGNIAEDLNHHPNIYLSYGRLRLELWSHDINSLSERDFKFAQKIDRMLVDDNIA